MSCRTRCPGPTGRPGRATRRARTATHARTAHTPRSSVCVLSTVTASERNPLQPRHEGLRGPICPHRGSRRRSRGLPVERPIRSAHRHLLYRHHPTRMASSDAARRSHPSQPVPATHRSVASVSHPSVVPLLRGCRVWVRPAGRPARWPAGVQGVSGAQEVAGGPVGALVYLHRCGKTGGQRHDRYP